MTKEECVSSAVCHSLSSLVPPIAGLTTAKTVKPDYDVEFANRPRSSRKVVTAYVPEQRSSRISETSVIRRERGGERAAQYIQAPRSSTPIIRPVTPPRSLVRAPSPPRSEGRRSGTRIELVSVEESVGVKGSPRGSRVSVSQSGSGSKGKRTSRGGGGEEVYIERERVRMVPMVESRRERVGAEREEYRYVEAPGAVAGGKVERRRSRSITYETNPRLSGRLVERERVVVEDGGRRREYYRRA